VALLGFVGFFNVYVPPGLSSVCKQQPSLFAVPTLSHLKCMARMQHMLPSKTTLAIRLVRMSRAHPATACTLARTTPTLVCGDANTHDPQVCHAGEPLRRCH
jgi:hypothetical protein